MKERVMKSRTNWFKKKKKLKFSFKSKSSYPLGKVLFMRWKRFVLIHYIPCNIELVLFFLFQTCYELKSAKGETTLGFFLDLFARYSDSLKVSINTVDIFQIL